MAAVVEAERTLSNVSLNERDLSGSERIFHGVTHKPQLFAFLYNKRYANLNNLLPEVVELKDNREKVFAIIQLPLSFNPSRTFFLIKSIFKNREYFLL